MRIGTDLVEIARISKLHQRFPQFAQRILTAAEWQTFCQKSPSQQSPWLAKRWAAKEAAAKALGTGFAQGVTFQDFEVQNSPSGAPGLVLSGRALSIFTQAQLSHCALSLSDERAYALAFVVMT